MGADGWMIDTQHCVAHTQQSNNAAAAVFVFVPRPYTQQSNIAAAATFVFVP